VHPGGAIVAHSSDAHGMALSIGTLVRSQNLTSLPRGFKMVEAAPQARAAAQRAIGRARDKTRS
jgi:hypothetical protein